MNTAALITILAVSFVLFILPKLIVPPKKIEMGLNVTAITSTGRKWRRNVLAPLR